MYCPKCKQSDTTDWTFCKGKCPIPKSPYYDWRTEMDYKVLDVKPAHPKCGAIELVMKKRFRSKEIEKRIQRLRPILIELIENCKDNGYWEETKKQSLVRIATKMMYMTDEVENEDRLDIILTLKRIKYDRLHW